MKKNLFKWMMAIAIVATPMVFTSCGSDDDDNNNPQTEENKNTLQLLVDEEFQYGSLDPQATAKTIEDVRTTMLTAMFSSVGQTFDPIYMVGTAILINPEDESKLMNALDATYARIKDTNLLDGYYAITVHKGKESGKTYKFGEKKNESLCDTITFENQALNAQKFWIGDAEGQYTYKEKCATVTATQTVWGTDTYWSGFAISGRTENTFDDQTPDQYNSLPGGAHNGNQFLVVQGQYNDYECVEFNEPVKVWAVCVANSAYAYNSMKNGDNFVGAPFTSEDFLSCTITLFDEDGAVINTQDVELAKANKADEEKYLDSWKNIIFRIENVKKMTFSFKGSRNNNQGLLTPAYMCVDDIIVERSAK